MPSQRGIADNGVALHVVWLCYFSENGAGVREFCAKNVRWLKRHPCKFGGSEMSHTWRRSRQAAFRSVSFRPLRPRAPMDHRYGINGY